MNMSSLSISQENAGHAPGWGPFVMQQLTPAVLGVHLGARHRKARADADRLLVKSKTRANSKSTFVFCTRT